MKRIFTFGLLVAAAFALTNCAQKESYAPVQEEATFEVVANLPVDTKTYNDGMSTKWSDDDQVSVIFTKTDGTSDKTDNPFEHEGNGKFVGKLEQEIVFGFLKNFKEGTLTVAYPFRSEGVIPASTVQNGYDSMALLAGANCPLQGSVPVSWNQSLPDLLLRREYTIPEVELEHITSVIEVAVKNNTAAAVNVNEVDFLVDGAVKATTVVEKAGALAAGETAKVYIVVEPGTYSNLSFTVNDSFVKTINAAEATFTAGKIKKVNFEVK